MVIVDDKPPNWPVPPPPYVLNRTSSSQSSHSGEKQNNINNRGNASGNLLSPSSGTPMSRISNRQRIHFADNRDAARSTSSFTSQDATDPPPFPYPKTRRTLMDLPQHVLLYIVQLTCLPSEAMNGRKSSSLGVGTGFGVAISDAGEWADHAIGLFNLATNIRLVSRAFYVSCMHILRSTYLPLYSLNIKSPYTSDPFPASAPSAPMYEATPYNPSSPSPYSPFNSSPLLTTQRETTVLDKFLLLKLHQDLLSTESELHLSSTAYTPSSAFNELFSLHQPTARLEDLVRHYGLQNGSITLAPSSSRLVSFEYVSIRLSEGGKRVGLVVSDTKGRKRVITEYLREHKEERLEVAAKRLAKELLSILKRSRGS